MRPKFLDRGELLGFILGAVGVGSLGVGVMVATVPVFGWIMALIAGHVITYSLISDRNKNIFLWLGVLLLTVIFPLVLYGYGWVLSFFPSFSPWVNVICFVVGTAAGWWTGREERKSYILSHS